MSAPTIYVAFTEKELVAMKHALHLLAQKECEPALRTALDKLRNYTWPDTGMKAREVTK